MSMRLDTWLRQVGLLACDTGLAPGTALMLVHGTRSRQQDPDARCQVPLAGGYAPYRGWVDLIGRACVRGLWQFISDGHLN